MLRLIFVYTCVCLTWDSIIMGNDNYFDYSIPGLGTRNDPEGLEDPLRPQDYRNAVFDHGPVDRPVERSDTWDLSQTFFSSLNSYEWQARSTTLESVPWIAKVVHSRTENYPVMCTASCIQKRLFITAARCLVYLKVFITTVHYQRQKFNVKAFALPSAPTKQMFDDVGIVVVHDNRAYRGSWPTVSYYNVPRTDNRFSWFSELGESEQNITHKVVGYVQEKAVVRIIKPPSFEVFNLKELDVVIDINACSAILTRGVIRGFYVPCYHSCTTTQLKKKDAQCSKYLGAEGAAVYNKALQRLIGVATWGCGFADLPVGFSVPNSINFFESLDCAQKILNDNNYKGTPPRGYHQSLCVSKAPG